MVMRYKNVVALGDFSPCPTAMTDKTYQMMVERRLRTRSNHDEEKRLWCSVNSGMGEYTFSAQELKGTVSFQLLGSG